MKRKLRDTKADIVEGDTKADTKADIVESDSTYIKWYITSWPNL